jgi:hypothetical protein
LPIVYGMQFLQWISTDTSNHIVGLAKIAAGRNIISSSCNGAITLFAFNCVKIHQVSGHIEAYTLTYTQYTVLHFPVKTCREAQDLAFKRTLCDPTKMKAAKTIVP